MGFAVREDITPSLAAGERFACITHSTGGPVVRTWISNFYGRELPNCPVSHMVKLAPANHGSALAQLGKGKLSRMEFSFLREHSLGLVY
jgi:triacylglycerol esterase/lipase EstA (alpha/beta hydrolase family)